jgi:hypothetical protein
MGDDKRMNISDEAVEAAAVGIASANITRRKWDEFSEGVRNTFRDDARAALEAAAPHLMAEHQAALESVKIELTDAPASNYEEDNYEAEYINGLVFAVDAMERSAGAGE